MNISRYEAFLEIARCHNFTHAAKELGYTQSAVSQMITALEKEVGTQLIVRGRTAVLTSEGKELLPFFEKICAEYKRMQAAARAVRNIERGVVSLAITPLLGAFYLPELLEEFNKKYPDVHYRILNCSTEMALNMVGERRVDMAITYEGKRKDLLALPLFSLEPGRLRREEEASRGAILGIMDGEEPGWLGSEADILLPDMFSLLSAVDRGIGHAPFPGLAGESRRWIRRAFPRVRWEAEEQAEPRQVAVSLADMNQISRTGKCFLDLVTEKHYQENGERRAFRL